MSNNNRNEEKQAWIRIVVKAIQTNFFYYYHKVHKVTILDELPLLQSLSSSSSLLSDFIPVTVIGKTRDPSSMVVIPRVAVK